MALIDTRSWDDLQETDQHDGKVFVRGVELRPSKRLRAAAVMLYVAIATGGAIIGFIVGAIVGWMVS
jgi:hypothetical protein